ncbi:MAG: type II secretion system protein GspC [Kofleriaceae bacterium]
MNGQALHKLLAALVHRTWLLVLVVTLVCAGFAATAVAALVEASYLGPPSAGVKLPAPRAEKAKPRVAPDGGALVVRNMFCSTCTPSVEGAGPVDSFVPNAILIATSVGDEPRCTVRVPASEAQGSYGIGDPIPGVGKVDRIGWHSIDVLDETGRRGKLDLLDQVAAAAGPGAATPDVAAAAIADPFEGRVKKIDDHTFEVDRELVRQLVSGAVKPGGMRVQPVTQDGQLKGLKLFGVKNTTIANKVGLQNGDTLVSINNNQIKSAQSLLDVYTQLDTLNVVELDGKRGDKPLALTLRLK